MLEKKGSRNRFSGVKEVAARLQEEKEKRLSRGSGQKVVIKADSGKGKFEFFNYMTEAEEREDELNSETSFDSQVDYCN